ncbi:hypothetical protein [Burkholderia sp. F1]|uniref:hypothetical protein n=1 Tax=Burkholderia sp. F1 TaxID=3366817 RepID=UPI003D736DA3
MSRLSDFSSPRACDDADRQSRKNPENGFFTTAPYTSKNFLDTPIKSANNQAGTFFNLSERQKDKGRGEL